ncbi:MAG: hypothetical protein KBS70_08770 [Bacteroidales bacterium]|nr:hypothetical protein [Candidatus Colicola equi]
MMKKILYTLIISLLLTSCTSSKTVDAFAWNKATVYFVLTDRFCNGDTTNDYSYNRRTDYGSEQLNASTFHGGDYAGLLQKAQEGYFKDLGIDVVWLTDPYEQIHGWTSGSGVVNDFPHYGYHGYYPLDYTEMDKNFGTIAEFRALINELHAQGIRVMLGANINDVGYPTFADAIEWNYAPNDLLDSEWRPERGKEYLQFLNDVYDSPNWFTTAWLRRPQDTTDPLQTTLYGLPDVLTEKTQSVDVPTFWLHKWQQEGDTNDDWTWPEMKKLRKNMPLAPSEYQILYISAWVREFGIDGYRCDVVEYVHPARWKQLYDSCNAALQDWRHNHPNDQAAQWTEPIYFTGDHEEAFITRLPEYEALGFASMVNMFFPKDGNLNTITAVWQQYADSMQQWNNWMPFSYLNNAYFRDAAMDRMEDCATSFLLAPGAVQIFYGDEVARTMSDARFNVDAAQAFRSDYDWNNHNAPLLQHYQILGQWRQRHPAVGAGQQTTLDSTTCYRTIDTDEVVIALKPVVGAPIKVPDSWNGHLVKNAYTNEIQEAQNGTVTLTQSSANVALLEINKH